MEERVRHIAEPLANGDINLVITDIDMLVK